MAITACVLIILWLLVSCIRSQRSLQWWYCRQSIQLCREAEQIRDGLLQETFTIRRGLELSLAQHNAASEETVQNMLATFERFHTSLKQLSDYLSPPYTEDSLPLAIQHLLEVWKSHYPKVQIEMNLPENWHNDSHQHNRLMLMTLDELLRIVLANALIDTSVAVSLTAQTTLSELKIQITQPNIFRLAAVTELDYLSQSFRFLMPGQCFQRQSGKTTTWYFRWRLLNTHPS